MKAIGNAIRELESQLKQVQTALAALRGLNGAGEERPGGKRLMSAEGRQRIVEAQRRRWAKFRAGKAKGVSAA